MVSAAAEQHVFERACRQARRRVIALVEGADAVDLIDEAKLQMILQIGADARPIDDDRNVVPASCCAGPLPTTA